MGGRKRLRAVAAAEPGVLQVPESPGVGAGEAEMPAWEQAKAPPRAPSKASTVRRPLKPHGKKRVRAPPVMPTLAEAQKALTEELTLTVDAAAVILKLSRHYAYEMVRKGDIPSIRIGRVIRIPAAALRAMLQIEAREAAE